MVSFLSLQIDACPFVSIEVLPEFHVAIGIRLYRPRFGYYSTLAKM